MTDKFDENARKIHRTLIQRTEGDVVGDEALVDVLARQAVRHANAIEDAIDWSKRNRRKQSDPVVSEPSPWTCLADQEPRTQARCWVAAQDPEVPLGWACRTAKWSAGADGFVDEQRELIGGRFASENQRNIYWCDEDLFDRPSEVMESIRQHPVEIADDPPKPEPVATQDNSSPWIKFGDPANDPVLGQECWVAVRYSNGNWDIEDARWQLNGGFMEWVDESRGSHYSHGSLFGPWNYRFFDIYWCDVRHFDDADAALASIKSLNP